MEYTKGPLSFDEQIKHLTFPDKLRTLLSGYPQMNLTAMGFPAGWENEPLWQ